MSIAAIPGLPLNQEQVFLKVQHPLPVPVPRHEVRDPAIEQELALRAAVPAQ